MDSVHASSRRAYASASSPGRTGTSSSDRSPCWSPFILDVRLPTSDLGPVDFCAFAMFAALWASLTGRFPWGVSTSAMAHLNGSVGDDELGLPNLRLQRLSPSSPLLTPSIWNTMGRKSCGLAEIFHFLQIYIPHRGYWYLDSLPPITLKAWINQITPNGFVPSVPFVLSVVKIFLFSFSGPTPDVQCDRPGETGTWIH